MIALAVAVLIVAGLLGFVGHRFELAARRTETDGAGSDAAEGARLYRRQARILYVIAGATTVLALLVLLA